MKLLRICAEGLPLFKDTMDLCFFAQQRVSEEDTDKLYNVFSNIYLNQTNAIVGINASGKTSVLKVIQLALEILANKPINHIPSKDILGNTSEAVFNIYFYSNDEICCLRTVIGTKNEKTGELRYYIKEETLAVKPVAGVKSKKTLTDFGNVQPVGSRSQEEAYLSDDVSFIIARNKRNHETIDVISSLSYTNMNVLPYLEEIPAEIVSFLDPTVEKLYFSQENKKTSVHLQFKEQEEIVLSDAALLEQYLSSGTIKGIITFSQAKRVLQDGGYLIVDEIENHFNKEIVSALIKFFSDSMVNTNGGCLIFSTHYVELLDIYDRNDSIFLTQNTNGIQVTNLSKILKRNDIKKSDAYQSGLIGDSTPAYDAYIQLKKSFVQAVS